MTGTGTCKNCSGIESCSKYCPIRAGENIVKFVNEMDKAETNIGEFRSHTIDKRKETLVVYGMILEKSANPVDVLKIMPQSGMSIKGKLSDCWGMTPGQILRSYLAYKELPKGAQNSELDVFKKFNSPKIVPTPFKIGSDIEIVSVTGGKKHKTLTKVQCIKWHIDESGNIQGEIFTDSVNIESGTKAKVNIEDYGVTWTLPNIERNLKASDIDRKVIKMNGYGLISPIEIQSENGIMALDGQHIYASKSDGMYIVGNWEPTGMSTITDKKYLNNNKSYEKIKSILKFVEKHKRFIVPYGLGKTNHISI